MAKKYFLSVLVTFLKKGWDAIVSSKKIPDVNPLEAQAQEVTLAKKHFPTKTKF